jgi:hypothetical protein
MSMNKKAEFFVTVVTAVSVLIILIVYRMPLSQKRSIRRIRFDLIVVIILAMDYSLRLKIQGRTQTHSQKLVLWVRALLHLQHEFSGLSVFLD